MDFRFRSLLSFGRVVLLVLTGAIAVARETPPPRHSIVEGGSFTVEWTPETNWQAKVVPASDCVVFQYFDEPARTITATIAVFRLVIPGPLRAGDRAKLGAAYGVHDVAGAQKALFGTTTELVSVGSRPMSVRDGEVFSYVEPGDLTGDRLRSTAFHRSWVMFPKRFPENGALYLIVAREQTSFFQVRPHQLDKVNEVLAGIRERP